ncbi:MAG: APC family permease [Bdellovibrionaceae bacterium]|nr:APC family permease [Pseudobdellovibrionaceae bacterium]
MSMNLKKILIGTPLSEEHLEHQKIGKAKALAVLSSDALSSVAYATEEILIPLMAFSVAAISWSLPIALAIVLLIIMITLSYRQTISAYPNGGGAYTVAKENLGTKAGLVAGAALLIDYVLTVAVSVAAGIENIGSAFPFIYAHREIFCILIIFILTIVNLRGIKDSSTIFAFPTYFFIFSFILMIAFGLYKVALGESPTPPDLIIHEAYPVIPYFLLMKAFASGCSALTGIEAISNGVQLFKKPHAKNAKKTMLWMSAILGFLFLGLSVLAHYYQITPKEDETVVSTIASSVFGKSTVFYFLVQSSTALILILAANTSYADFPRLSSLMAKDGYLPRQLASLGDRLVFSNGILGLGLCASLLIFLFGGETHHLIPLYAVGVFLSFTLSQLGMVIHHFKIKEPGWIQSGTINAIGAIVTGVVLVIIASTKFTSGAWMAILLIPYMAFAFSRIRSHYNITAKQLGKQSSTFVPGEIDHITVIPISGLHPGAMDAIAYAKTISTNITLCYVDVNKTATEEMILKCKNVVPSIKLEILPSPYRSIISPMIEYIDKLRNESPHRLITVIIPEFITSKWYHNFLHNQTALWLMAFLRNKKRVIVTSIRYHLE